MTQTLLARRARQRGFTLVEVTISLFVTLVVLLGVLALFDFSNRLSRVQTNISDMQQSLRVAQSDMARMVRMAGCGDLPQSSPDGAAVSVSNNVADSRHIGDPGGTLSGGDTSPEIVPGSDVLTIRGVFSTPVYQITPDGASFTLTPPLPGVPTKGTIRIPSQPPSSAAQDLSAIKEAIAKGRPEALLLNSISPRVWAIVELDPGNSDVTTDPKNIVVAFKVQGGTHTDDYLRITGGSYPSDLSTVNTLGLLEEYRFYVRREYAIPNDKSSDLTPKLSRARAYPGTRAPWNNDDANWKVDIADNIFDLQVALGYDSPAKDPAASGCAAGTILSDPVNCGIYESADGENDDWMYNGGTTNADLFLSSRLYYVRLSTLARTDRRDKDYESPTLTRVEDNTYDTSPFNTRNERMYRHRILRTVIDMRNL